MLLGCTFKASNRFKTLLFNVDPVGQFKAFHPVFVFDTSASILGRVDVITDLSYTGDRIILTTVWSHYDTCCSCPD